MIIAKQSIRDMINAPARKFGARAELYNGSALVQIFSYTDALKEFTVDRVGDESKFFGYGICQRLNVRLLDPARQLNITTANTFEIEFGVNSDYLYPFPFFNVSEARRDENTNELSITAYDILHSANKHTFAELGLPQEYTIKQCAVACANLLGVPFGVVGVQDNVFDTKYAQGANFEGTEGLRDVLDAIAEATQTIYYINNEWRLVFKRLDVDGDAVLTLDKERYITLDSKTSRRLAAICSTTELGDNVTAKIEQSGTTQYLRDNPFLELREDIAELLTNAIANVGGLTINQFDCAWRGNFLLEIGDKIELVTKDNNKVASYVLNDTITYNGFFAEQTQWHYTDSDETESNPATLGETLKQTYARVNKQDKKIELFVQEVGENLSSIEMSTAGIVAQVANTSGEVEKLTETVESKMSADEVSIAIKTEMSSGVSSVVTEKGFTFSDEGLRIAQSGSQMESLLDEDGLKVYRDNDEVLKANNVGVEAINVKVRTYLIVGDNSRFETYDGNRTGCFWIG